MCHSGFGVVDRITLSRLNWRYWRKTTIVNTLMSLVNCGMPHYNSECHAVHAVRKYSGHRYCLISTLIRRRCYTVVGLFLNVVCNHVNWTDPAWPDDRRPFDRPVALPSIALSSRLVSSRRRPDHNETVRKYNGLSQQRQNIAEAELDALLRMRLV